jgi:hypothetical protein
MAGKCVSKKLSCSLLEHTSGRDIISFENTDMSEHVDEHKRDKKRKADHSSSSSDSSDSDDHHKHRSSADKDARKAEKKARKAEKKALKKKLKEAKKLLKSAENANSGSADSIKYDLRVKLES